MLTVVNIRGTSGCGKSHLVRRIMSLYPSTVPCFVAGRKRPQHYLLSGPGMTGLLVPGSYETPCGGCDTIKTVNGVYEIVRGGVGIGLSILYEGIMCNDDQRRAIELDATLRGGGGALHVVALTTPVDVCLAAIEGRRKARGDDRPLNPKNTVDRARRCEGGLKRLEAAGVSVWRLDREAAFNLVRRLLGFPTDLEPIGDLPVQVVDPTDFAADDGDGKFRE